MWLASYSSSSSALQRISRSRRAEPKRGLPRARTAGRRGRRPINGPLSRSPDQTVPMDTAVLGACLLTRSRHPPLAPGDGFVVNGCLASARTLTLTLNLQKNPRLLNSAGDAVASFRGTGVRKELGHPQSIGIGLKSKCRDWRFRGVALGVEYSEKRR